MDNRTRLASLTSMAFNALEAILDASNGRHDEDYVEVAKLRLQAASLLVNTTSKTDELKIKARTAGVFEKLLETINREEQMKVLEAF